MDRLKHTIKNKTMWELKTKSKEMTMTITIIIYRAQAEASQANLRRKPEEQKLLPILNFLSLFIYACAVHTCVMYVFYCIIMPKVLKH